MSTICKTDPNVRKARTRRKVAQQNLEHLLTQRVSVEHRALLVAAIERVNRVRSHPAMTGQQKESMLRQVLRPRRA